MNLRLKLRSPKLRTGPLAAGMLLALPAWAMTTAP